MESSNHVHTGKLSLYQASLPGLACRWKSHPLLCAPHTVQHEHQQRLFGGKKKKKKVSSPISPFVSATFSVMWQSDRLLMATSPYCIILRVSESLRVFVLSVWCWCYLCLRCMTEDHMKWLTALAWPTFFYHSVIVRSMCDASQLH